MVVTYKSLHKVKFPLYALKSENWWEQDGLLFLDNRVLDDKNMRGSNLGLRRAQTGDPRLYKLNKQIISVQGVLKSSYKYFIDSNGTPFIYEKTKMCKLSYKKIQKVSNEVIAVLLLAIKLLRSMFLDLLWTEKLGRGLYT